MNGVNSATHREQLEDRNAIRSILEAYFSSIDRRDWVAYGQCFTDDARVEFNHGHAQVVVGREAIVKRAEQRRDRPVSNHLLGNTHISIADRRATVVTHAIAHLIVPHADRNTVVVRGLVYEDELVVDADRSWRISKRSHRPLWQYEAPSLPLGY